MMFNRLTVWVSRAGSSRNTSRVSSSVGVASRDNGKNAVAEGVVRADRGMHTSGPLGGPLAYVVSKLASMGDLGSVPFGFSSASRYQSGDTSWGVGGGISAGGVCV